MHLEQARGSSFESGFGIRIQGLHSVLTRRRKSRLHRPLSHYAAIRSRSSGKRGSGFWWEGRWWGSRRGRRVGCANGDERFLPGEERRILERGAFCGTNRRSECENTPASMMLPSDTDQKACAHTNGLLMTGHEVVVVSRFQIPTKTAFAIGPEHEVSGDLTRD